jgi:parvulin-like peptidyl-prolyl isomerase
MRLNALRTLLATAALLAGGAASAAAVGIFGSYIAIDADGPGAAGFAWYGGTQPGPTTGPAFHGADLGDFALGATAYISGAEVLSWKNGGGDVTGAVLSWRVNGGAFTSQAIGFTSDLPFNDAMGNAFASTPGDQKWAQLSGTPAGSATGATGAPAGGASFATPGLLTSPRPAAVPAANNRLPSEPVLIDRIVAIVNAEAITDRELRQKVDSVSRRLTSQGVTLPPPQELQRQLLERMIGDTAQQQAAREAGIRIDEVTIDRAVARIAQESQMTVAQFRARLEADGVSFQAFRQDVASELTVSRFREREIDSRIQVSESEVDVYLAEQKTAAIEFNMAQILVPVSEDAPAESVAKARQQAQSIVQMARAGGDFARIVGSMSSASGQLQGGITGMRTVDRLPALFVEAVTPLKPAGILVWLQ